MKSLIPLSFAGALAACAAPLAPVTLKPAQRALPTAAPTAEQRMDMTAIGPTSTQDLLWSASQAYGEDMIRRALSADAYIFAKHYPGMLPPPPPGATEGWPPEPPVALLFREDGRWVKATDTGVRQPRPDKMDKIEAILAAGKVWSEPVWAPPGCTDAGASLLLANVPGRREIVRSATCGATAGSETLVFAALEA